MLDPRVRNDEGCRIHERMGEDGFVIEALEGNGVSREEGVDVHKN